jgi:hypothetical protein
VNPPPKCRERFDTGWRELRVVLPSLGELRRHRADRRQIQRSVVELDPALVDLDRAGQELGGLAGTQQRARHHHIGPRQDACQRLDLRSSASCQFQVGATEVATEAIGFGLPVPNEDQHDGSVETPAIL